MVGFVFGIVLVSTFLLVKLVNYRWTMKLKLKNTIQFSMMVGNGRKIYTWQEIKVGVCIFECHNVIIGQHTMKSTIRDSKFWSKVNHLARKHYKIITHPHTMFNMWQNQISKINSRNEYFPYKRNKKNDKYGNVSMLK
jgi:hypothetical protein